MIIVPRIPAEYGNPIIFQEKDAFLPTWFNHWLTLKFEIHLKHVGFEVEVSKAGMMSVVSLIRWWGRCVESEWRLNGGWMVGCRVDCYLRGGCAPRWFDFWIGEELDFTHDAWLNSDMTVLNLCNATGLTNYIIKQMQCLHFSDCSKCTADSVIV